MILRRVERHIIDRQNKWFKILREKCFLAKNVYNHGNYLIRQEFFNSGKYLGYSKVEKLMHDDMEFPDYWNLGLQVNKYSELCIKTGSLFSSQSKTGRNIRINT